MVLQCASGKSLRARVKTLLQKQFLVYKTLWKEIMTEDTRRIEYRFLHWGPFVCNYTLLPEEIESFKLLESGEDYRNNLAGHLENEKALDKEKVFKLLTPYLNSYMRRHYHEYRAQPLCNGFEIITSWVNRQKKNEFNPPHTHDGHLSFVIYTEIPQGLHKECHTAVANSPGPGCITFDFNLSGSNVNKFFYKHILIYQGWRFIYFSCGFTTLGISI